MRRIVGQTDNRGMRCFLFAAALALALGGCSPTLNWREIRFDGAELAVLLPCKPDRAERSVPLAGQDAPLRMQGCDAGDATYAVAHVALADAAQAGIALAHWRAATLANMHAQAPQETPFVPAGALALSQSVRVTASGRRADGRPVQLHGVWFARAHGSRIDLFHAALYAERPDAEASQTFLGGLRFP